MEILGNNSKQETCLKHKVKKKKCEEKDENNNNNNTLIDTLLKAKSIQHLCAIIGISKDEYIHLNKTTNDDDSFDHNKTDNNEGGFEKIKQNSQNNKLNSNSNVLNVTNIFGGKEFPCIPSSILSSSSSNMTTTSAINHHPIISSLDMKDIQILCTLCESEDSQEQLQAMSLVNRSRLQIAKLYFNAIWNNEVSNNNSNSSETDDGEQASESGISSSVKTSMLYLSGRQEQFPFSYSHRNRVLIGSVILKKE